MNSSVFTPERANYYRALISIIELHLDNTRDPQQYRTVLKECMAKKPFNKLGLQWQKR